MGGDWREIDDPERFQRRLSALGRTEVITEMMCCALGELPLTESVGEGGAVNVLERIIGADDLLSTAFLTVGAQVARSVGRVVSTSSGAGFGTGSLISSRLLLTNNHVLPTRQSARSSAIQFDYVQLPGSTLTPVVFELDEQLFFETSLALDYTLVAVRAIASSGHELNSRGWSPLIAKSGKTLVGELVNIVQHPGGELQKVALRENRIVDVPGNFLHYQCDTEPGSSGSPVFNDQWELSALHHAGVPEMRNGRYVLKDGTLWNGARATRGSINWLANEGIRISQIVKDLKQRMTDRDRVQQELFEACFLARPRPRALERAPSTSGLSGRPMPDANSASYPPGTTVLHIPVELRVAQQHDAVVDLASPPAQPTNQSPSIASRTDGPSRVEREVRAALSIFEDRSGEPYFDESADLEEFEEYYTEWPESATGEEWFSYFSSLVQETHHRKLTYREARIQHLYPWVDLREAGGARDLASIYSGASISVEESVRIDIEAEQLRSEMLQARTLSEGALSQESIDALLDELEASMPFNCEHVVPQSWFAKREPMKSDLHHLFTCESACNSFRSNIPYFDFGNSEAQRDMCGVRVGLMFEPESGKGAVARATLYFLLRYPGLIGDENRELQRERLPVLLQWHSEEPPDEYEFHRNRAIFQVQGNRNPFIDLPQVADVIDFGRGFGA